jgi:hypothetical protein
MDFLFFVFFVAAAGLVVGFLWMINSWVESHGLVVQTPHGVWELDSVGWDAVWPILLIGLLVGLFVGLGVGARLDTFFSNWLSLVRRQNFETRALLAEERQQLESDKSDLDWQIKKAAEIGRREGLEFVRQETLKRNLVESKLYHSEMHAKILGARLKGAQQKSARQKRALQKNTTDEP